MQKHIFILRSSYFFIKSLLLRKFDDIYTKVSFASCAKAAMPMNLQLLFFNRRFCRIGIITLSLVSTIIPQVTIPCLFGFFSYICNFLTYILMGYSNIFVDKLGLNQTIKRAIIYAVLLYCGNRTRCKWVLHNRRRIRERELKATFAPLISPSLNLFFLSSHLHLIFGIKKGIEFFLLYADKVFVFANTGV